MTGRALIAMRDCFCGIQSTGSVEVNQTEAIGRLTRNDSVGKIENVLNDAGESWKAIVKKVGERFPGESGKEVYLAVIKVLGHE